MKTETPCYGMVCHSGGTWTVVNSVPHASIYSDSAIQGYGDFPHDKYPGIPLLRFDRSPLKCCMAWIRGPVRYVEGCNRIAESNYPDQVFTLPAYLERAEMLGVAVER